MNVDRPLEPFFYKYFAFHPLYTLTNGATACKIRIQASKNREKCSSWSKVLYETGVKNSMYDDKAKIRDELIMTLTAELPVMRARLGMSQEVMASAIGVSRQTYSAIETRTKKMSWTMFMALIAVLDMNEATSVMLDQIPDYIQTIRQLTEKSKVIGPLAV